MESTCSSETPILSTTLYGVTSPKLVIQYPEGGQMFLRKLVKLLRGSERHTPEDDSNIFLRNICKLIRNYTPWTPGPWRWMRQAPPKVGEFLSHCKISHSGRQKPSLSRAWKPHTSHTAISFAAEGGEFWPNCSFASCAKKSREEWNNVTLIPWQETLYNSNENEKVLM
jgi:hypothetical protein